METSKSSINLGHFCVHKIIISFRCDKCAQFEDTVAKMLTRTFRICAALKLESLGKVLGRQK